MILSAIVASTENGVIGKDGKMPWHLPAETAYFRKIILGRPVIMGRKNYESMSRPLPDSINIVITRQHNYPTPEGVIAVPSVTAALELPVVKEAYEVFIVGGQQIYEQALPLCSRLYLTIIHTKLAGDTFFNYNPSDWKIIFSEHHKADMDNKFSFTIKQLVRK